MHILYDPATLAVQCCMYDCHEVTAAHNRTLPNHIEIPGKIPHDEIRIVAVEGKPTAHRIRGDALEPFQAVEVMPITAPERVRVGDEMVVEGVPEGVAVTVDGVQQGVMDATGRLEITAEVAGFYRLMFSGPGWISKEVKIEAVAR